MTPPEPEESEGEEGEGGGEGGEVMEVGSVRVSEWGLEHTLRLRGGEDGEGEDTLTPGDCQRARQEASEGETESVKCPESQPTSLPVTPATVTSPFHTPDKSNSGTARGTPPLDSPFSLSCIGLPTTPLTPTATPRLEGPMSWWAEALAETENMEDIDALVEQLEGTTAGGKGGAGGKEGKKEKEREVKEPEAAAKVAEETEMEAEDGATGRTEEKVSTITGEEGGATSDPFALPSSGAGTGGGEEVSSPASAISPASPNRPVVTAAKTTPIPSRSPSPSGGSAPSEEVAYIAQAGRLIRQALQYEQEREFEEAFDLFKAAVDVLLNGVQSEGVT